MYYVANGKAYIDAGNGKVKGVSITAKDKVTEVRELESVTVEAVGGAISLPSGASTCTLDEVVAKFNVSESNPLTFKATAKSKAKEE